VDLTICYNKKDVVEGLIELLLDRQCHLIKEVREVGRTAQRDIW